MPYGVERDEQACSAAEPWACKNTQTGEVMGCHASEEAAQTQLAALMANVEEARSKLASAFDAGLPEYRSLAFADFEATNDGWGFDGLLAVYGEQADLGAWTEEFRHGAFRKPLSNGEQTVLTYEHSQELPALATTRGGTMRLKDDVKGVRVQADIAQHYVGEAARELIKRGDISGMSPGMVVGKGNSEVTMGREKPHRAIRALKHLPEVSLTPGPVYAGTTAEMRSMWALKMAESLGPMQHVLMGAYPQLENRASTRAAGTGEDEAETETCETCGQEPCSCDSSGEVEEQRSGVTSAKSEAAARRRRLQMMGLSLP